jgi:hypothetical protein
MAEKAFPYCICICVQKKHEKYATKNTEVAILYVLIFLDHIVCLHTIQIIRSVFSSKQLKTDRRPKEHGLFIDYLLLEFYTCV